MDPIIVCYAVISIIYDVGHKTEYYRICSTILTFHLNVFMQLSDNLNWVRRQAYEANDLSAGESSPNRDHTTNTEAGYYLTVDTKRPNSPGILCNVRFTIKNEIS